MQQLEAAEAEARGAIAAAQTTDDVEAARIRYLGRKEGKLTSTNPTKGTIFFDSKNGRIASAEISIDLKGDLMVTIGGTDTKVELQQNQKTTIKTGDTSFLPKK